MCRTLPLGSVIVEGFSPLSSPTGVDQPGSLTLQLSSEGHAPVFLMCGTRHGVDGVGQGVSRLFLPGIEQGLHDAIPVFSRANAGKLEGALLPQSFSSVLGFTFTVRACPQASRKLPTLLRAS